MRSIIPGKLAASLQLCASPGLTALSTQSGGALNSCPVEMSDCFSSVMPLSPKRVSHFSLRRYFSD